MEFLKLFLLFAAGIASSEANLQFVGGGSQNVIPLASNNLLVVGSGAAIVDSAGLIVKAMDGLGGGKSVILAAAIDPIGDIWIAGQTDSDDFPLVHPLFAQKPPYQQTLFVAKLDTNLKLLFSTFLGGTSPGSPDAAVTTPTGIAIDNSGNAYLTDIQDRPALPLLVQSWEQEIPACRPMELSLWSMPSLPSSRRTALRCSSASLSVGIKAPARPVSVVKQPRQTGFSSTRLRT
jgi:hypothetical protein